MWGDGSGARPADAGVPAGRTHARTARRWLVLLCLAAGGTLCAGQQADLGPHDIGGHGCAACHVVTSDASGKKQYAWAGEIPAFPGHSAEPQPEEGWAHSARCLSCHDGALAQIMDIGAIGPWNRPTINGPHPINVGYQPKNGSLFPVRMLQGEWHLLGNPENPVTRLKLFPRSASDPTPTVQCASCHDPHDHRNPFFLRDPYDEFATGTRFCRTCHAEESQYAALP